MRTLKAIEAKPRFEVLDGLRGVAAMMVVAFHLFETYSGGDHTRQIINHGYLAVDFFFALSGFVIGYAYDDRWAKGMGVWTFFKRRLIRLHPLLILGTTFGALLFYFQSDLPDWSRIGTTPWWMLALVCVYGFTLIPIPKSFDIRGWGEMHPLNNAQWSLMWEYIANILYALVIRRFPKWLLAAFVAFSAILTAILCFDVDVFGVLAARSDAAYTVIGGWSLEPHHLQIAVTRLFYPFFAGLLISRLKWSVPMRRGGFAATASIIAIVLAMPYFAPASMPWINGLYETVAILFVFPLVVMMGAGSNEGGRLCRFLGEISYPLYVTHYPLVYVQMSWAAALPNLPAATHAAVGVSLFILAIAIAYASLKLYDIPVRKWLANKEVTK